MKKIFSLYLSFLIAISPVILMNQANAAIGGWSLSNPVAQGASAVYDATKTVLINGKNVVKTSVVTITPTAAEVTKVLARGGATLALTVAVEQLLGAVDWVLDPANNQIRYYETDAALPPNNCATDKNLSYSGVTGSISQVVSKLTAEQTVRKSGSYAFNSITVTAISCYSSSVEITYTAYYCETGCSPSTNWPYGNAPITGRKAYASVVTGTVDREQKTLPLETVAAQVISNAESETDAQRKAAAQTATMAAAADIVQEAETDDTKARPIATQLDQAATTATEEAATGTATQTKTDPATGEAVTETTDLALAFPTFCGWAPLVCEAAQTVISFPQTLTNWWETATTAITEAWVTTRDWFMSDEDLPETTQAEISDLPIPELQENAISWSAQCPNDVDIPVNLQGVSSTITFSWSPWCQLLSMIKPAIVASAYIGAAFIVLGLRT